MISEGSCDTEDWSNDAENSALHHRNKLHFNIHIKYIFNQMNASLVNKRDVSQKHKIVVYVIKEIHESMQGIIY